jgi:chemotaxis regulatin CheY-phosphate phosphatase CheZ
MSVCKNSIEDILSEKLGRKVEPWEWAFPDDAEKDEKRKLCKSFLQFFSEIENETERLGLLEEALSEIWHDGKYN